MKVLTLACETRPQWARERAPVLVQFILKQYNTRPDFACAALQCLEMIRSEGKRISEGDILDVAEVIIKDDVMKVDIWYGFLNYPFKKEEKKRNNEINNFVLLFIYL